MNGVRTTFMRRGYLFTALSALLLLAASSGTASAQSIGFVGTSGSVAEAASFESGAFEGPHVITIKGTGIPPTPRREGILDAAELYVRGVGRYAIVNPQGGLSVNPTALPDATTAINLESAHFNANNEAVLLVLQGDNGSVDGNWLDERIIFTLEAGTGTSISPNVYTVTVDDTDVAPVAKFTSPSFTLTEGSEREVAVDIFHGITGRTTGLPSDALLTGGTNNGTVTVRVSNHEMVTIGGASSTCPETPTPAAGDFRQTRKAFHLALSTAWVTVDQDEVDKFGRTARITTTSTANVANLAADGTAGMTITACDVSGFRDQQITLTIDGTPSGTGLVETATKGTGNDTNAKRGDFAIGDPLTVTVDSNESAPTLSFSPTDVTIDEGDSVSTRLIADGMSATEVGMVKLMVEGDAMVSLMHEDTMLEEMDGYVMVDMGRSNSVRLTAMSHESRELQDGDMAYKAWKLTDDSSDAMIGDDSWFRVDVRGSTAVPALPLIGQLLLALFLMAGGSRLYRRRRG